MPPKKKAEMAEYSRRYSFWKYQYTVRNEQFQREFNSLRNEVELSPEWHAAEHAPEWEKSGLPPWVDFLSVEMGFGKGGELEEYERLLNMYGFDNTEPAAKAEDIIKKLAAGEPLVPHKLCGYESPLRPPRRRALSWDGDTPYATLTVNLKSPIKAILAQVEDAVGQYRAQAEQIKQVQSGDLSNQDVHFSKIEEHADEVGYAIMAAQSASRANSEGSRAIGLWLYDYINKTGVSNSVALCQLEKLLGGEVANLKPDGYENTVIDRYIRKTKDAILFHEVIAFT